MSQENISSPVEESPVKEILESPVTVDKPKKITTPKAPKVPKEKKETQKKLKEMSEESKARRKKILMEQEQVLEEEGWFGKGLVGLITVGVLAGGSYVLWNNFKKEPVDVIVVPAPKQTPVRQTKIPVRKPPPHGF